MYFTWIQSLLAYAIRHIFIFNSFLVLKLQIIIVILKRVYNLCCKLFCITSQPNTGTDSWHNTSIQYLFSHNLVQIISLRQTDLKSCLAVRIVTVQVNLGLDTTNKDCLTFTVKVCTQNEVTKRLHITRNHIILSLSPLTQWSEPTRHI